MAEPAYAAYLAAVPADQIAHVRHRSGGRGAIELIASRVEHCPHDLTALEVFPLGQLLAEAIDIGQPLRNDAWHPLRVPVVVDPETVTARAMQLDAAVDRARHELGGLMAEALGADIDKVRQLYTHASARGEAVVTFLAGTGDDAGVPRVRVVA